MEQSIIYQGIIPLSIYLLVPSGILICMLGSYTLYLERNKKNFIFFLLSISQALWSFGTFLMWRICGNDELVIFWDRLLYVPAFFMPCLIYHFSLEFCRLHSKKHRFPLYLSYLIAVALVIVSRTDYFIKDVFYYKWGCHTKAQVAHHIFPVFCLVFLFLAVANLFKVWRNKKETFLKRSQAIYIFWGFVTFMLVSLELLPPYGIGVYPIFYLGLPLFILIVAYAITQKQLLAPVILTDILVAVLLVFLSTLSLFPELEMGFLGKLIFFVLVTSSGFLLIKHAHLELDRRKKVEKMSKQLKQAYAKLKKLDMAKTEFLSIASHQLRTPLTIIKGYVSMLVEGDYGKMPEKAERPLSGISKSNDRLIVLVNDLLTVSRIETGKIEMNFEKVYLRDMILDLIQEFQIEIEKKGIYLKLEKTSDKMPKISIDKFKIRQTIFNIIDNAIKYTNQGGITIKCVVDDENYKIIITDTGEGMTKQDAGKLFKSFSRGPAGIKFWTEGAGLGLYVSKKFVELHNGKVWVESKGKGHGSSFYVALPFK